MVTMVDLLPMFIDNQGRAATGADHRSGRRVPVSHFARGSQGATNKSTDNSATAETPRKGTSKAMEIGTAAGQDE